MSATSTPVPARRGTVSRALARDRLGVPAVLAFILAGVAPLTVAAGLIPTAYAVTGLTGIPAAFLAVAVILAVFASGYTAMSRSIQHAGAFYSFIAHGLGRAAGVAAALMALLAYSCLQIALYGMLGPAAAGQAAAHLGVHAAWWAWALGAWAVVAVLGLLRVDITGRVLGTLTAIEIAVILAEAVTGLAHPAGGRLSFATLSPSALTSSGFGTVGVLAVIAVLGFSGFEQAPVLAEEARHPRRTIPVTTYTALGLFPGYFRILVEHAMAFGLVCTTPQRTAAALWLPATGPAAPADGYAGQLAEATGPFLDRFLAFDEELGRHHLAGVFHHHLAILAVRPDQQGQGTGTALLQAHHTTFDWQGIAANLEASDERSRGLYLRHGYTDHGTPIRLPGGPLMYPMVRRPPRATGGRRWPGAANGVSPRGPGS